MSPWGRHNLSGSISCLHIAIPVCLYLEVANTIITYHNTIITSVFLNVERLPRPPDFNMFNWTDSALPLQWFIIIPGNNQIRCLIYPYNTHILAYIYISYDCFISYHFIKYYTVSYHITICNAYNCYLWIVDLHTIRSTCPFSWWTYTPGSSWKIWARQWEGWHPIYYGK